MKLMFASDIHGSYKFAKLMVEAFKKEQADKLVLLGDLLYHGPRNDLPAEYEPKKVIELLNNIKDDILCVRGNCEAEVDQMVLDFPCMAEYSVIFLENSTLYITHGHNINPENPIKLKKGDYLMNGHTHIGKIQDMGDYTYLNPGSVSIPKDNRHSYMVYENGTFKIKDLIK